MRISYKIFASLLVAMSVVPVAEGRQNDWANFGRYAKSNQEVISSADNGRRVVFLGNSITDNWASMRPGFFADNGFIGRGISGQTTYQFLSRFRNDVIDLHPRLVVINAATNDVAENTHEYNEDMTFGNIVSMVELAKANNIKVILTTTLPAAAFGWNPSITDGPSKIKALNKRLAEYAKKNKIPFVDYYSVLVDEDGVTLPAKYSKDGVHPTDAGYEIMEATVLPVIRKIVK